MEDVQWTWIRTWPALGGMVGTVRISRGARGETVTIASWVGGMEGNRVAILMLFVVVTIGIVVVLRGGEIEAGVYMDNVCTMR